jgi:hypothetical protein
MRKIVRLCDARCGEKRSDVRAPARKPLAETIGCTKPAWTVSLLRRGSGPTQRVNWLAGLDASEQAPHGSEGSRAAAAGGLQSARDTQGRLPKRRARSFALATFLLGLPGWTGAHRLRLNHETKPRTPLIPRGAFRFDFPPRRSERDKPMLAPRIKLGRSCRWRRYWTSDQR